MFASSNILEDMTARQCTSNCFLRVFDARIEIMFTSSDISTQVSAFHFVQLFLQFKLAFFDISRQIYTFKLMEPIFQFMLALSDIMLNVKAGQLILNRSLSIPESGIHIVFVLLKVSHYLPSCQA